MEYKIGVMQGRLLPRYNGCYQAHPVGYWQEEFWLAANLGFDLIEFILDFSEMEKNPLIYDGGLDEILDVSEQTGVTVQSICADYLMAAPIHCPLDSVAKQSQSILKILIINAFRIGVRDIVVPCVDQSSLTDIESIRLFTKNLRPVLKLAEEYSVNLALETDLPPQPFYNLLKELNSPIVTVNYDTGNSASLGYNLAEELAIYGDRITDIHIKDRIFGGSSVELGSGNTDFDALFEALSKINYNGPFIMQAYRDDEGIEVCKKQMNWIKPKLEAWASRRAKE